MAGFSNITGQESIIYADNASFNGSERGGKMSLNGQLWIGATASPHVRLGTLSSSGGSITITNGAGTIDFAVNSSTVGQTITGNSGGALSPTAGNWNILGTGSLTASGSGSSLTTSLTGLTNHALLVGAGTATITKLGLGLAGQVLQSGGALADPVFSTATYPSVATSAGTILRADGTNWVATTSTYPNTNAISTLLYASASNVMSALATANNGMLVTSATGVPSILAGPGVTGKILQSNAAAAPSFSTATYPSVATGTGTILRADGTNWVATTATYPATTTAFQLLVSTATSVVGGLTVGTTGQLLNGITGAVPVFANSTTGNYTFTQSVAGTAELFTLSQTDNTNGNSHAGIMCQTGGTSGGDSYIRWAQGTAQSYCIGIDHTDANKPLKMKSGANATTVPASGDTTVMIVSTAGSFTHSFQPMASVYVNSVISNVTGDGTIYGPVIFDTKDFDQQTNFSTVTGLFTCPVGGIYLTTVNITFEQVGAAFTSGEIQIRKNASVITRKEFNPGVGEFGTDFSVNDHYALNCTATETIGIYVIVSGSTKTVDIKAAASGIYSYASFMKIA